MFQHSVRAANTIEMFEQQDITPSYLSRVDPCSASEDPVGRGIADKCLIQGLPADQLGVFEAVPRYPVNFHGGGNPYLEPEEGDTFTVGAVISPERFEGFTMSVDYYELEVNDSIGGISSFDICFDPINADHVFCDNLVRDATGNLAEIFNYTSNLGFLESRGIDTQISYQTELTRGTVNVNLYWTHLLSSQFQENPVTTVYECEGLFGWPCLDSDWQSAIAENRTTTNIHYASGPLGIHLSWRWIEGTDNAAPLASHLWGIEDPDLAVPSIDDEHYVDLGLTWEVAEWLSLRLGITNLLDNDPPQMADSVWANNTDTGLFDVFGRSYYLTLRSEF
jgi:outer membrane receptor protein involved in Fe transport